MRPQEIGGAGFGVPSVASGGDELFSNGPRFQLQMD